MLSRHRVCNSLDVDLKNQEEDYMPTKKSSKSTGRRKRLLTTIPTIKGESQALSPENQTSSEEAIVRQFHRIQKDYNNLMSDLAKELELVKNWIGSQAMSKQKDFKDRLNSRLSIH